MSRFQFSVPGRRDPDDGWFRVGTFDVGTTTLIAAISVISMLLDSVFPTLLARLALLPEKVRDGEVWRIASWPLIASASLSAVITIAIFWWLGRELERVMGRIRYSWFLVAVAVVPAVICTIAALTISGFAGGVAGLRFVEVAVFCAFVARMPMARFFFGIPGWVIALVFVGIDLLQFLRERSWFLILFELLAIAVALLLVRAMGHAEEATWIPALPGVRLDRGPKRPKAIKARRGESRGDTVVAGPWPGNVPDFVDQEEIDRLLDKVAATGLASLTKEERQRLEAASRRKR